MAGGGRRQPRSLPHRDFDIGVGAGSPDAQAAAGAGGRAARRFSGMKKERVSIAIPTGALLSGALKILGRSGVAMFALSAIKDAQYGIYMVADASGGTSADAHTSIRASKPAVKRSHGSCSLTVVATARISTSSCSATAWKRSARAITLW